MDQHEPTYRCRTCEARVPHPHTRCEACQRTGPGPDPLAPVAPQIERDLAPHLTERRIADLTAQRDEATAWLAAAILRCGGRLVLSGTHRARAPALPVIVATPDVLADTTTLTVQGAAPCEPSLVDAGALRETRAELAATEDALDQERARRKDVQRALADALAASLAEWTARTRAESSLEQAETHAHALRDLVRAVVARAVRPGTPAGDLLTAVLASGPPVACRGGGCTPEALCAVGCPVSDP